MKGFNISYSVIQNYIKATRKCDNKFLCVFICMPTTVFTAWNIINPKHAFNLKRDMSFFFHKRKITTMV